MKRPKMTPDGKHWANLVPVKDYYTLQEVSWIMSCATPQLYNEIRDGSIRAVTVNNVIHLEHAEVLELIRTRTSVDKDAEPTVEPYIPTKLKGVKWDDRFEVNEDPSGS